MLKMSRHIRHSFSYIIHHKDKTFHNYHVFDYKLHGSLLNTNLIPDTRH
ncbi:hypothetical protein BACPEC_02660 [[Bacteroides] pectinophilus ATCC 43243]|uniref:Uncharacterized protein n=1 Tax=[Bacteroides] pectinophilus ATCC 43243 TaxID=483218 RepID=B7AVB2_9FIRM|nr:hypothetical protein BACPEC_02660 [[Bacteroides] pectinophilus ATCC 43243]